MVALVFCGDLKYCPYISRYVERLEKNKIKYNVYFWNRSGECLNLSQNYLFYDSSSKLVKNKLNKMFDFYGFQRWLVQKLREDNPAKLIVLSTLTGVVLRKYLKYEHKKYIFDIRDYSYEHILPFFWIEKNVINDSVFTAISSKGFINFLPRKEYVIAHNFNRQDIRRENKFHKHSGRINFVWNGVVRYFDFQRKYIDALANDDRFQIVFHGDGPELERFKRYCKEKEILNVSFTGAYDNSRKSELLANADILNNCYGYTKHAGKKIKYAVSNRFYDGILYHIPQLVEPEGFKHAWAKKLDVGASFYPGEFFANELYDYYMGINEENFDKACFCALQSILNEDDEFIKRIDEFIKD